jgi:hypothetical protein
LDGEEFWNWCVVGVVENKVAVKAAVVSSPKSEIAT